METGLSVFDGLLFIRVDGFRSHGRNEICRKSIFNAFMEPFEVLEPSGDSPVERLSEHLKARVAESEQSVVVVFGIQNHNLDVFEVLHQLSFGPLMSAKAAYIFMHETFLYSAPSASWISTSVRLVPAIVVRCFSGCSGIWLESRLFD